MNETNFGDVVLAAARDNTMVVQPRMGVSEPASMRAGLAATRAARARTVGTITVDSYTRLGQYASVEKALTHGSLTLNGYPIITHPPEVTRRLLDGVLTTDFPIQVRHGSAMPGRIISAMTAAGLHATEGGPISYCLPYGRTPITKSVEAWAAACRILKGIGTFGPRAHLETFGGCMMGQLCPPSLLVATSILEAYFFRNHGIDSVSLSYTQQTNKEQDIDAIRALRILATEYLPDVSWHIVMYAYMGVFPETPGGATLLLQEGAEIATIGGAERLIVKTVAESRQIPTVGQNVQALEVAASAAHDARISQREQQYPDETSHCIAEAARSIISSVLAMDSDIGHALIAGVRSGVLDIPYCLHPDNAGNTRATVAADGRTCWTATGNLPAYAARVDSVPDRGKPTSKSLLTSLTYVQRKFDTLARRDDMPPQYSDKSVQYSKEGIRKPS